MTKRDFLPPASDLSKAEWRRIAEEFMQERDSAKRDAMRAFDERNIALGAPPTRGVVGDSTQPPPERHRQDEDEFVRECNRQTLADYEAAKSAAAQEDALDAKRAARDVLAERARQVSAEGWTAEHDDEHDRGALAQAAISYIVSADGHGNRAALEWWPWDRSWWKPTTKRRDLVKAGALILAEIERLDRHEAVPRCSHGYISGCDECDGTR